METPDTETEHTTHTSSSHTLSEFERKTIPVAVIAVCGTFVVGILFWALWPYKELLAGTLVALFVLTILVLLAGLVNEQFIRHRRYKHLDETPLSNYRGNNPMPQTPIFPYQESRTTGSYQYPHATYTGYPCSQPYQ